MHFSQNCSINFFINSAIWRSIINKYSLQVSRTLKTGKAFKLGLKYNQLFPLDFVFTSERPHYSVALFSSFIYTCTFSKKIEFASKRTLDYFPKKYPEYANNWLVVTDSSESGNGERHGSSCRMQYLIILLGL